MVGHGSACHAVTPGQRVDGGDLVEPTPDGEHGVGEDVGGVLMVETPTEIPLQGVEDHAGDRLEPVPPVD
jgi:hypothetical protein